MSVAGAMPMERNATAKPRQVSVLLRPLAVGSAPLRLRETGADDISGEPVCAYTASTWKSRRNQPFDQLLLPRRRSLGPSVHITACPGTSDWLATPVPIQLSGSPHPLRDSRTPGDFPRIGY